MKVANELLKDNGGVFQKFEWIHDPYAHERVLVTNEKKAVI